MQEPQYTRNHGHKNGQPLLKIELFFPAIPCPPQVICDSRYIIIAACCNTPGSTNDRLAYREAEVDTLVESLPGKYFVLEDAAYGATDKMIVPYPGCDLDGPMDAFNFYQSQGRMCIEQTFEIMVSVKSVLIYIFWCRTFTWRNCDRRGFQTQTINDVSVGLI